MQLQSLFQGLCADESMPVTLTFIKNGVETVLMRMDNGEGGVFYVGTPRVTAGNGKPRIEEHALVLTPDLRVEGTYALNSIAVGGWKRGSSKDPGFEARAAIKDELISTLITAAILVKQGQEIRDIPLIKAIERETGFEVTESPSTPEQIDLMSAVGIRNHIAQILEDKGWSLIIYPQDLAKRLRRYCEVVSGEWDAEARSISTTAALPYGTVKTLKSLGYTLRKRTRKGHPNMNKKKNDLSTFG